MLPIDYKYEGSKGGSEESHTPVETPNNLLSVAYAKVLLAVGEGEFEGTPTGKDIYLNGTPLISPSGDSNFGGVTWEWRSGTVDQTYIKGNPEVSNEVSVGVEVTQQTPWTQQISKTSLSAARITLQFPALLQQLSNGDTVGYSIDYAIDISTDGSPFVLYKQYQVSGKTNTAYERTHRVDLPTADASWALRVRRISANSQSSLVQDKMNIKSFAEVIDAKQRYPNTALLFVQFDSRLFGGGAIPKISVKTKGRIIRVPSNYDPETRAYTGVWSGDFKWAWSDNPAWVFFDLVTQDRFGLGGRVTVNQVDKWKLYEVAQYCDVMVDDGTGSGAKQPRHTCNIYIQSKTDAWQVLRDICNIFNGMTYWNGNQFVAIADKLEPVDNIPTFSRSDVINGIFDYQATDERSIYTSALVSYDEPDDHYETQVEAVWEKSQILRWRGDRQTSISAIGCTVRGEAQRKGKYNLITNMFNRSVTFKTGLQGLSAQVLPGSIIGVADPLISGKPFTGRIVAATPTVVTLDRVTEAKSGDLLFITLKSGKQESRTIKAASGKVITVTTAYSEKLLPNATWYLESEDLKSQLFKVVKVTSPEESIYEINAVEYNTSKYAAIDNGARLEPRPISKVPPSVQQPPASVTIAANTFTEQTMAVTTMTISYPATDNAVLYEGEWRVGQGDWVTLGTTGATEFTVRGVYTGKYLARVRAINALGIKSLWKLSNTTDILGKTGAPPALTSLAVTPIVFGMQVRWTFPTRAEDTARTEVMYSKTPSFANATKLGDFAYPQQLVELNGLAAATTLYFWARLVDRSGNFGPYFPLTTANGVQGKSSSDATEYEKYFLAQIKASALNKELNDRIDLIDGSGVGSVNERLETVKSDLEAQIKDFTDALEYDPKKTYLKGDIVRVSQRLYQARRPVPVNITPPNEYYWYDIGTITETTDALALQVSQNTTNIDFVNGKADANAQQINIVKTQVNDPTTGLKATSDGLSSLKSNVSTIDGKLTATTEKIDGVYAWVDSPSAGNTEGSAGDSRASAGAVSIMSVIAERDLVIAQRTDVVEASVQSNIASITEITKTVADDKSATANKFSSITASVNSNTSRITDLSQAFATEKEATTTRVNQLTAKVDDNTAALQSEQTANATKFAALTGRIDTTQASVAAVDGRVTATNATVQQVSNAQADLSGKASAMWAVKLQVNAQGQYVAAGIGLGIENGPAGLQSTFLVQADKFAVINGANATVTNPFTVTGGQVFIRDAIIANGSITNAKIGGAIQSDDYVANTTGWQLPKTGPWQLNGSSGGGRMTLNNTAIRLYHPNGVVAIDLSL